jgi:two-component system sensor histidine kinase MprB
MSNPVPRAAEVKPMPALRPILVQTAGLAARWTVRWRSRSLLVRLIAATMLALGAVLAVVVIVVFFAVRHELVGQIDDELGMQSGQLRRQAQFAGQFGSPALALRPRFGGPAGYVQVVSADGKSSVPPDQDVRLPVAASDRAVAAGGPPSFREISLDGAPARMLTAPLIPGYAVEIAQPLTTVDGQLRRLTWISVGVGGAGLVLAGGSVWLIGRRILTPVARLTAAAEKVAATRDLAHRIADGRPDELGRLAASFNTMLSELEASLSAQRQLVADASHELRTPLASLRTNVEVLVRVDELDPVDREAVITAIVTQLDELTALVSDVVELARGDEPDDSRDDVRLDQLVDHAAERAQLHWPAVEFQTATEPVVVRGNAARLDRAVTNLLDNAAKFSPPGAAVETRLAASGELTVRDHGRGIDENDVGNLFSRFYRASDARSLPGSGLGLAIVKQVADAHGAQVSLGNAPGGGAVASLRFTALDLPPFHESPVAPTRSGVPSG